MLDFNDVGSGNSGRINGTWYGPARRCFGMMLLNYSTKKEIKYLTAPRVVKIQAATSLGQISSYDTHSAGEVGNGNNHIGDINVL